MSITWDPGHGFTVTHTEDRERTALAICSTCPLAAACEQRRADTDEARGIWAGVNHDNRPHDTCGTVSGYWRHKRHSTTPCRDCHSAHLEYKQQRRARGLDRRKAS